MTIYNFGNAHTIDEQSTILTCLMNHGLVPEHMRLLRPQMYIVVKHIIRVTFNFMKKTGRK